MVEPHFQVVVKLTSRCACRCSSKRMEMEYGRNADILQLQAMPVTISRDDGSNGHPVLPAAPRGPACPVKGLETGTAVRGSVLLKGVRRVDFCGVEPTV